MTSGEDDIMLVSQGGQAIRFARTMSAPMGRPAAGVIGIRLAKGDRVIASESGRRARISWSSPKGSRQAHRRHFITKGRGGKGVTAMRLTQRTGQIVGAGMVDDEHNLMLMSTSGKVIRLPVSQIPTIGRQTQGVTLMKLDPDEMVATMTIAERKGGGGRPRLPPLNGHGDIATCRDRPHRVNQ